MSISYNFSRRLERGWPMPPGEWQPRYDGLPLDFALQRYAPPMSEQALISTMANIVERIKPHLEASVNTLMTERNLKALHSEMRGAVKSLVRDGLLPVELEPVFFKKETSDTLDILWREPVKGEA